VRVSEAVNGNGCNFGACHQSRKRLGDIAWPLQLSELVGKYQSEIVVGRAEPKALSPSASMRVDRDAQSRPRAMEAPV
jgi:hypothetical protein